MPMNSSSPYISLALCLILGITGIQYWNTRVQNRALENKLLGHKQTLEVLKETKEKLTNAEKSRDKACKENTVKVFELTAIIEDYKKKIEEKDARALELGKRLSEIRTQYNQARYINWST